MDCNIGNILSLVSEMNVSQSAGDCPAITEMAATCQPLASAGKHGELNADECLYDLTRVSLEPATAVLRAATVVS